VLLALAVLSLGHAPIAAGQRTLETDSVRLEIIGLTRWTIPMIQDSLAVHSPGDSLTSHACAAILRQHLKFADAAVIYYPPGPSALPQKGYYAVTVIEPQDSARVRYRPAFRDSQPNRTNWSAAIRVFESENQLFQRAIQDSAFLLGIKGSAIAADLAPALPLRRLLRSHRSSADLRLAMRTLSRDRNPVNRAIAVVLLANFAAADSAWWALAETLRDPHGMVSGTAQQVLSTLAQRAPRPIDWAPATGTLRAVIDGTNLSVQDALFDALAATQVAPRLAPQLLGGGGDLVLAKLQAEVSAVRGPARRFLVQVSGLNFGDDVSAWQHWINSRRE
jgi:hypothetical protein